VPSWIFVGLQTSGLFFSKKIRCDGKHVTAAAAVECMHWWGCQSKLCSYALSYLEARLSLHLL